MQKRFLYVLLGSMMVFQGIMYFTEFANDHTIINFLILTVFAPIMLTAAPSLYLVIHYSTSQKRLKSWQTALHFAPAILFSSLFVLGLGAVYYNEMLLELIGHILRKSVVILAILFVIQCIIYIVLATLRIMTFRTKAKSQKKYKIVTKYVIQLTLLFTVFVLITSSLEIPYFEGSQLPNTILNTVILALMIFVENEKNLAESKLKVAEFEAKIEALKKSK